MYHDHPFSGLGALLLTALALILAGFAWFKGWVHKGASKFRDWYRANF